VTEALDFLGAPLRVGSQVAHIIEGDRYRSTRIEKAKVIAIASSNSMVVLGNEGSSHEYTMRPDQLVSKVVERRPTKGDTVVTYKPTDDEEAVFVMGTVDVVTPRGAIVKFANGSEDLVHATNMIVVMP
jgi:hypothetical protein